MQVHQQCSFQAHLAHEPLQQRSLLALAQRQLQQLLQQVARRRGSCRPCACTRVTIRARGARLPRPGRHIQSPGLAEARAAAADTAARLPLLLRRLRQRPICHQGHQRGLMRRQLGRRRRRAVLPQLSEGVRQQTQVQLDANQRLGLGGSP